VFTRFFTKVKLLSSHGSFGLLKVFYKKRLSHKTNELMNAQVNLASNKL